MRFANILNDLLNEYNLSQAALAKSIGFSQRAVSKWINAQAEPTASALTACANYFGISVDELLGRSDDFGTLASSPTATPSLPADETELLKLYRQLPYEGKQRLIARAEVMLEDVDSKNKYGA